VNLTVRPDVTDAQWDAYQRLQVALETGSGVDTAQRRFVACCTDRQDAMRVLAAINSVRIEHRYKPSVLDEVDHRYFFARPAPAVLVTQRSSGARRAGRAAAPARHDRWQLAVLTLVSLATLAYLLYETMRGVG